jgi:hypothetical protein
MFIRVVQPLNRLIFAAMNTMISIAPQDLSAHIYLIRGRNVLLDDIRVIKTPYDGYLSG